MKGKHMQESIFQFGRPVLRSMNFTTNDEYDHSRKSSFHNHFRKNVIRVSGKNEAVVELDITVGEEKNSQNIPYTLKITMGASFSWDGELKEEMVNHLLYRNAPSLLLGYARPVISGITSSAGWQYDIPFMDFSKDDKDEGAEQ